MKVSKTSRPTPGPRKRMFSGAYRNSGDYTTHRGEKRSNGT